jgi:hypothetical protein
VAASAAEAGVCARPATTTDTPKIALRNHPPFKKPSLTISTPKPISTEIA